MAAHSSRLHQGEQRGVSALLSRRALKRGFFLVIFLSLCVTVSLQFQGRNLAVSSVLWRRSHKNTQRIFDPVSALPPPKRGERLKTEKDSTANTRTERLRNGTDAVVVTDVGTDGLPDWVAKLFLPSFDASSRAVERTVNRLLAPPGIVDRGADEGTGSGPLLAELNALMRNSKTKGSTPKKKQLYDLHSDDVVRFYTLVDPITPPLFDIAERDRGTSSLYSPLNATVAEREKRLAERASLAGKVALSAVTTDGAEQIQHCEAMPRIPALKKVEYRHKKPKRSEHTPLEFFALLVRHKAPGPQPSKGGEKWAKVHRVQTYVPWREIHGVERAPKVEKTTKVTRVAPKPAPSGTITLPRHYHIQYRLPIRFGSSLSYNISQSFGMWGQHFVEPSSLNAPTSTIAQLRSSELPRVVVEKAVYPQRTLPQPPSYYSLFRQAWVSDGNAITCTKAFTTGACMWEFKEFPVKNQESPLPVVIAFCDYWCNGYFHFTHEHLPRLALVHHLLMADPRKVYITAPRRTGYVMQYLVDVFGLKDEQIIARTGAAYYANTVVLPQPQKCGSIFTETLFLLRKIVFQRLGLLDGANSTATMKAPEHHWTSSPTDQQQHRRRKRKVGKREELLGDDEDDVSDDQEDEFISAGGGSAGTHSTIPSWEHDDPNEHRPIVILAERKKLSRMPRNYEEVKVNLTKQFASRVRFIETHGLTVVQQIRLFFKAVMVIGPHGANLSNLMWMRHGAYVLEFMSYKYANMCYYGTASRLGLYFGALFHGASKAGHYNTTSAEIATHIETVLALLEGKESPS